MICRGSTLRTLRSKRFRLVSERRKIEERTFNQVVDVCSSPVACWNYYYYIGFAVNQTFPALTYKTPNGFVSRKGNCPRIYIIFLFYRIKSCESNFRD